MIRHQWVKRFHPFRDIETNPATQYRVHTVAQRVWITGSILMNLAYLATFMWPKASIFIFGFLAYCTNQISFYANWSTDNGAAAASKAVMNTDTKQPVVTERG